MHTVTVYTHELRDPENVLLSDVATNRYDLRLPTEDMARKVVELFYSDPSAQTSVHEESVKLYPLPTAPSLEEIDYRTSHAEMRLTEAEATLAERKVSMLDETDEAIRAFGEGLI